MLNFNLVFNTEAVVCALMLLQEVQENLKGYVVVRSSKVNLI